MIPFYAIMRGHCPNIATRSSGAKAVAITPTPQGKPRLGKAKPHILATPTSRPRTKKKALNPYGPKLLRDYRSAYIRSNRLNGIQEVSGSIPLISTIGNRKKLVLMKVKTSFFYFLNAD
jgi:hypothetical protein